MKHDPDCWCRHHCNVCGREATTMDSSSGHPVMLCAEHAQQQAAEEPKK